MTLDEFIKTHIEAYLIEDLRSMTAYRLQAGRTTGALGYPLVMTLASGIELLGTISFESKELRDEGGTYFDAFWSRWLYPTGERAKLGRPIYELTRNGIAHVFLPNPRIKITRLESAEGLHLNREQGTEDVLLLDVDTLAHDFVEAFGRWKADIQSNKDLRAHCQMRLERVLQRNDDKARNHMKALRNLTRAALPTPSPRVVRGVMTDASSPSQVSPTATMMNISSTVQKRN